jgi:hypothetical protein
VNATLSSRPRPARRRSRRGILVAAGALAATALLPSTVANAKSPHQVDPALMVPTLNPSFAPWSCWKAGSGITCQGTNDSTYTNEPLGLQCGGQDVFLSGREDSRMTRWHTADGLATKTVIHYDVPADTFSLSPGGGGVGLTISGHFNRHYVYAVPGDLSSRTLTEVGAIYLGRTGRGGPMVLQDTGRVTFAPGADYEVVTSMSGVHDAYSDPAAVERVICDALT